MATDWSMTHSPTLRYLVTHLVTSLSSLPTFSVLKLGLADPRLGHPLALYGSDVAGAEREREWRRGEQKHRRVAIGGQTHVRPVERFMPARNAETKTRTHADTPHISRPSGRAGKERGVRLTEDGIEGVMGQTSQL